MTKHRGFTLLELLIVVIIISVAASLAVVRHARLVECNTRLVALRVLQSILAAEKQYRMQYGVLTADINKLPVSPPNVRTSELPIVYTILETDPATDHFIGRAEWKERWLKLHYQPGYRDTPDPPYFGVDEWHEQSAWCGPAV